MLRALCEKMRLSIPGKRLIILSTVLAKVLGIFQEGNYVIDDSCSFVDGQNSKGWILANAISMMRYNIQHKILVDVQQGMASSHGYTAFFKTNDNKDTVTAMYTKILEGAGFMHRCAIAPYENITFTCPEVTEYNPNGPDGCGLKTHISAVYRSELPYLVELCPVFFYLPKTADPRRCPSVRKNKMTETALSFTQVGTLVHEWAHIYGADPAPDLPCTVTTDENAVVNASDVLDVYRAQACAELPANRQILNAQNYALYYSGKSLQRVLREVAHSDISSG